MVEFDFPILQGNSEAVCLPGLRKSVEPGSMANFGMRAV